MRSEVFEILDRFCRATNLASTRTRGQLKQDLMEALHSSSFKSGYFVEFGALDGVTLSNTYWLEKELEWTGIVCEPNLDFSDELCKNRTCIVDKRCVWSASGEILDFAVSSNPELSTITSFEGSDVHAAARRGSKVSKVETVSLIDLLTEYDAPKHINFLSVDTEGSELEILEAFDFSAYSFDFICVEHNFGGDRDKVLDLLNSNGYTRKYTELSRQDDWFVRGGLL